MCPGDRPSSGDVIASPEGVLGDPHDQWRQFIRAFGLKRACGHLQNHKRTGASIHRANYRGSRLPSAPLREGSYSAPAICCFAGKRRGYSRGLAMLRSAVFHSATLVGCVRIAARTASPRCAVRYCASQENRARGHATACARFE